MADYIVNPNDTKFYWSASGNYHSLGSSRMFQPVPEIAGIYVDELPSVAGTLLYNNPRTEVQVGDFIPAGTSLVWLVKLPPTAEYSEPFTWHWDDTVIAGETYPAGTGLATFKTMVLPPSFNLKNVYTAQENTLTGTSIGRFYVNGLEPAPITATISGSLAGSELGDEGYDLSDLFYINKDSTNSTGSYMSIRVKNGSLLDYERLYKATSRNASYAATITASNSLAGGSKNTNITFADVNEGPAVMEDQTFNFPDRTSNGTIQPAGTIVGQVIASDPDIYMKPFSTLYFRITSQTGNVFGIDHDSGKIYIVDGSGLYVGQTYEITVMAVDGEFSKSATMTINITRGGRILTWNGKLIQPLDRTGSILRV